MINYYWCSVTAITGEWYKLLDIIRIFSLIPTWYNLFYNIILENSVN